jgi:hypothetical protein
MKAEKRIIKTLAAFAFICGLSISAHAQLGSGWTPDNETYIAQNSSGTTTTAIPGGFEFKIPVVTGLCRAEMRGNDLPTNTTNQWQGLGTLVSFPSGSNNITCHQVFGPAPSTPDLILDESHYSGGIEIMSLEQGDAFEAQIQVGVQFQMNTIYDPVGNLISIYVNGSLTGTKTPNSGIHYNKYGQYVSKSGFGPSTFDWVNVQSWAGGTAGGGGGNHFTITASAGSGGSINPTGAVTVNQGANQTFSITANSGFSISSVTVDGANQGAISSYTFSNVQANHTISAAFTQNVTNFTITASAGSGGSISPSGAVTVAQGSSKTFSITANSGFTVSSVTVDGANQGAITSYTFSNVQANHTIAAAFSAVTTNFTITASAGSGGSISPSGAVTVAQGASQSFSITANSGFTVSSVTVDGANQGAITSYTFSNVQANHTIAAAFSATSTNFTITASAGSGGSISPSGAVTVAQGASQSFSITANSGFTISSVTVDGASQGAITSYTFSNVQANHTISASFQSSGGGCQTAAGSWTSYATSTVTGTYTATFDATPHASGITAFIGMTNGAQTSKSSAPWLVKFHSTGDVQALNGTTYTAVSTINWVSGSTYHFRVVVNLTAGTYSAFVTPPGQAEQTLATNYAFQVSASTLNNWGMQDTASSLVVCNFAD